MTYPDRALQRWHPDDGCAALGTWADVHRTRPILPPTVGDAGVRPENRLTQKGNDMKFNVKVSEVGKGEDLAQGSLLFHPFSEPILYYPTVGCTPYRTVTVGPVTTEVRPVCV